MSSYGLARSQVRSGKVERGLRVGCGSVCSQHYLGRPPRSGACFRQRSRRLSPALVAVASGEEAAAAAAETSKASEPQEWYALVANAEFMLNEVQNESLPEQLRERTRFFQEKNREIDFYLVPEPVWLDKKYPEKAKLVGRPCVALVSTDKVWTTFMKLRLDQVLRIDLGEVSSDEALEVGGVIAKFDKPKDWRAPYPKYASGWWEPFLPKDQTEDQSEAEPES